MKRLIFLLLPFTLFACTTVQAAPTPISTLPAESAMPTQTPMLPPETSAPAAQSNQILETPVSATNTPLFLSVLEPIDEAVVDTPQVKVIGMAPQETVVTVNDEILLVGEDQKFEATIALDEGPNLIEIIASDLDGNEASQLLTVFYEP